MRNCLLMLCLLTGAFADLRSPKDSGVIVNPFYDPKDDVNDIKKDLNEILPPTHQQLAETLNLRNVINNAVRSNTYYVVGGSGSSMAKPKTPFSWFGNFLGSSKNVSSAKSGADDVVGSAKDIPETGPGAAIPNHLTNIQADEIKSNLIDSIIVSKMEKKPFSISPKKVQREQLELISIEEDVNFPHGHNTRSWITIDSRTSDKSGLVGVSISSLVLIVDRKGTYAIVEELDLKTEILSYTNYQHWNDTSKSVHGIVIVEIANQLLFVSTGDDLSGLRIVWQWTIHSRLDSIFYFKHESSDMMLMINLPFANDNGIAADIYRFDLQSRHTWLIQKIPLNDPCKSVTVINTYRELILCFAQNNTVELYKNDQQGDSQAFKYLSSIEAKSVQTVSGFEMGGYAYLATTGLEPKILRYHRGSFVAQAVLSRRWGLVEFIFPIAARTYRDDLILLVQHRIMMGTHSVAVVEALIWDGESFDVSLSVPCRIGNQIMDFGMTCLLDYDRDTGIAGISIIQNGNSISLIVPRVEAPSSMFRLQFQLTAFDSPSAAEVKDFRTLSKYIEATTNYQNEVMSKGTDALTRGLFSSANRNDVNALWNFDAATADNLIVSDGATWNVNEIYFGNEKWSAEDLSQNVDRMMAILQDLKRNVDVLEKEFTDNNFVQLGQESPVQNIPATVNGKFEIKTLRRLKRTGDSDGHMKVSKLNVKNIKVDYINDIPIEDVIFTRNEVLNSVSTLTIEDNLNVSDEVEVPTETVGDGIEGKHLLDKLIPADNIQVAGSLIIDSINGVVWQDFVEQIIMRNLPYQIDELEVKGDILAKENIAVDFLNLISFPNDFLWMHDSEISTITGEKVFNGMLTADSVDTSATVDGIYTQETISLVEVQHIRGLTTFTQLEVTETLDVNGTINGKHLSDFKPNLSLLETNIISSDCLFQNLQVEGPIFISNDCNGLILDEILSDVVYKSNPKSTITSFKTFESIESIVDLTSNLMNNIPVGDYMSTDTAQDIHFDRFIGNVLVQELYIDGMFDFINVTELDSNSIKLAGEQFTEAELIFDSGDEIIIEAVEIKRSFNGLSLNDLIRVDESLEINGNVVVNNALINDLVISGELNGNGMVNGVSLTEFDMIRFSRTRSQDITSMYHIENVVIENEIDSTYVNGLDIIDLRKHINHITNLPEFLSSGDVFVSNLVIDGSIVVHTINGHDFSNIKDNAVCLNQPNIVNSELKFLETFEIGQGIIANSVNGEIFETFIDGLVLKTDENVEFTGRKIFQNEFHVEQDIQANTLNGILTVNVWTKSITTPQITGQVNVMGNLFVENVNLQGFLNTIYWREIEDKYHFDAERSAHILTGNVRFTSPTNIIDIHIRHGLNSVENITDLLSNVIRKDHAGMISGKKQFINNVIFTSHLQASSMDTVDIPSLLDNVAINDLNQKIVISGDVAFENDVAAAHIHVSGDILASTVMDCSLSEWNENGLSINSAVKIFQQLVFPAGTFQAGNVGPQFLNGNSMATIFTLNTDQSFAHTMLSDLISFSDINVEGLVNGYNVKALMDNSVLVTGDNYITAPTTVQSARVLSVLQTIGTINGKNVNNVATLNEDLYLSGPLSILSIKARNLNTKDTISGIDFDYWYANALWKSQRENQIIRGVWTVSEGIFHSSVNGVSTLNGVPVENLAGQINAHQSNVLNNLAVFYQNYVDSCNKMQDLIHKTQTLPYFVTHFEESFSLRVPNVLNSVHFFEVNGQNYVAMNLGCVTVLYAWNRKTESYEKLIEAETGNVDSWLDMTDELNSVHLVSNTEADRSNCPTSGLNIWKFDGTSLVHVSKVTESNKFSLLHASKLHPDRFLAMTKDDVVVNAFDLQNNLVEQWHLPTDQQQFRFVPENANLGIALSNGKQLSSLSYAKAIFSTDKRKERSTGPYEAMSEYMKLKRTVRCPFLEERLENATAKCKLWHQANLKALSNIGPYKHLDIATRNRLLNDVNMTNFNIQLGSSPFKLRIIPSERGPFQSSQFVPIPAKNFQSSRVTGDTDLLTSTAGNQFGNENRSMNSTARDAFGDIEKAVIDMADNIVDPWIELDATNEDVDFDDSLIGSSPKNESEVELNSMPNSMNTSSTHTNSSQPSSPRDMFGDIEAKTIKFTDKVMDALENFKDTAKESQAKLHNMFKVKPVHNDGYRKIDEVENKNLPKIPKVIYTTNDTDLLATQSPPMYGIDGAVTDTATDTSIAFTLDFVTSSATEPTKSNEEQTTTNAPEVGEEEPKIANEIFSEGIATAENLNFPNHPAEEIVAITVGENKKHLVAVSSLRDHTIQGKHDLIRIYEDIIEGNLFQTLICHRPRSLSVLNVRDETILAFIENDAEVQIFAYRGIQGFIKFTSFELPSFIYKLTAVHLAVGNPFDCKKSYLAATLKKEIRFIEAKTCGYCGVDVQLRCD